MAFKLKADPTFVALVGIPVAGGTSVLVPFIFKHRTWPQIVDFENSIKGRSDLDVVMDMVEGWVSDAEEAKRLKAEPMEEAFTKENLEILIQNRVGLPPAIFDVYKTELLKAREKN
jgi:hypothetical protein